MSDKVLGTGKSRMLSRIFLQGFTLFIEISKPAYSTSSRAKQNFFLLNTIPFLKHRVRYSHIWKKASRMVGFHKMVSSTIFSLSSTSEMMRSYLSLYASPAARKPWRRVRYL